MQSRLVGIIERTSICVAVIATSLGTIAPARADATSARGFIPLQAYASGLNETVNLYNFNAVVSVPLSSTKCEADKTIQACQDANLYCSVRGGLRPDECVFSNTFLEAVPAMCTGEHRPAYCPSPPPALMGNGGSLLN